MLLCAFLKDSQPNNKRWRKKRQTRFFSHIQKDYRRFFSFVWVRRTSRFSFKRLFQCSNFHCQTFFLIFTLTSLPCAPLNVKEKGCGGRFIWEQSASHVTHLFYGASFWIQQHSWSSSLDLNTNFLSAPSLLSLETCRASAIVKESLGPGICNPLLSGTLYLVGFKWC